MLQQLSIKLIILYFSGTWVAQLVKHLILAQVMISQLVGLSPTDSLEPGACFRFSASLFLSPPPPLMHILSLSIYIYLSQK